MVKVTLEVPEALLGDIYIAVGSVLQRGQDDRDEQPEQAGGGDQGSDGELASQAG